MGIGAGAGVGVGVAKVGLTGVVGSDLTGDLIVSGFGSVCILAGDDSSFSGGVCTDAGGNLTFRDASIVRCCLLQCHGPDHAHEFNMILLHFYLWSFRL